MSEVEGTPPSEFGVNLGSRLRKARIRSGLTLREVARQLGVSASFVSQLENGKSQPSVVTLYSLTQLLGVSIDQMFEPDEAADPTARRAARTRTDSEPPEGAPADAASGAVGDPGRDGVGDSDVGAGADGYRDRRAAVPYRDNPPGPPVEVSRILRSDLGSLRDAWPQHEARPHLMVTSPGNRRRLVMDWGVIWDQLAPNSGRYFDFMEIVYPPGSSSTNDEHMLRHSGFETGYLLEGELEVTCGFEVVTLRPGDAIGMDSAVPHLLRNRGSVAARGIWCVHHDH